MYNRNDIECVKNIILGEIPDANAIYLFGSYARGTASDESDMDFAVLVNRFVSRSEKLQRLATLRRKIAGEGYSADLLLKEENLFKTEKNLPTLSKRIFEEGVVLWRKD